MMQVSRRYSGQASNLMMLIVLAVCTTGASAGDAPNRLYVKAITTEPRTREELLSVPLDSDVYAASQENYYDLTVTDGTERTTAFIFRTNTDARIRDVQKFWTIDNPALKIAPDSQELRITVALDDKQQQPDGVRIVTPLRNFEHRVRVYGIGPDDAETQLTDALIFDYAKYMDVRQHDVRFERTEHRRFLIVIDQPTSEQESQLLELSRQLKGGSEVERNERTAIERRPFRIDRLEFFRDEKQTLSGQVQTTSYPVTDFKTDIDEKNRQTLITISSRREPLSELTIETTSRNFNRALRVQVPDVIGGQKEWRDVTRATISHLEFRDLREEHLAVSFSEQRENEYRIVIENGDNMPLNVTGITARGAINEIVFLAQPELNYQLYYGTHADQPIKERAQYDTAAINASLANGIAPFEGKLAAQTTLQEPAPARFDPIALINSRWVLAVIIIILVAVLGCGLYIAGRKFEQLPHEDAPPPE